MKTLSALVAAAFLFGSARAADPATQDGAEPRPDQKPATKKPADSGKQPKQPGANNTEPVQDRASKHGFKKKPEDINRPERPATTPAGDAAPVTR